MLFSSYASGIGRVLVCARRHCFLRRSRLMPLSSLAVCGCTWVLCLGFAIARHVRFNAFLPAHARQLPRIAQSLFLLFERLEIFQRVAIVVVVTFVMAVRVAVPIAVITQAVRAFHTHVQTAELIPGNITPVATSVLTGTAGAACEVLHAIHSKPSASITGRHHALSAR